MFWFLCLSTLLHWTFVLITSMKHHSFIVCFIFSSFQRKQWQSAVSYNTTRKATKKLEKKLPWKSACQIHMESLKSILFSSLFFPCFVFFFNKTEDHMTERREEEPPSSYLTAWVASFKLLKHHHGRSTMGAFIIYLEGGLWWFWGGSHSFSLLWFRGGCGKFPTTITSSIGGANHFFPEKEKEVKICFWTQCN